MDNSVKMAREPHKSGKDKRAVMKVTHSSHPQRGMAAIWEIDRRTIRSDRQTNLCVWSRLGYGTQPGQLKNSVSGLHATCHYLVPLDGQKTALLVLRNI